MNFVSGNCWLKFDEKLKTDIQLKVLIKECLDYGKTLTSQ
jgi:hypothetical protein